MRGKRKGRKRLSLLLAAMLACAAPQGLAFAESAEAAEQEAADRQLPANPEHHCIKDGAQTDATDWDVICFGSYPQGEVTELTDEITNAAYDADGDALVDGVKYRRIGKTDAAGGAYFGDAEYRYFKWEPIRWRVLENDGETLLAVADKGLDCKKFNEVLHADAQPWADSDLRNWLNGEFYQAAFDDGEQEGIVTQTIKAPREDASEDNIWLISSEDALNPAYGFCGEMENRSSMFSDKSSTRWMQASDYAHARGAYAYSSKFEKGNTDCCRWWLRNAGSLFAYQKQYVTNFGSVVAFGVHTAASRMACVPALRLSVSSPCWSYVGRESSLKGEGGGNGGSSGGDGPVHHCTKKSDGTDWTEWSYYEFGSYPQGEVTDPAITALIDASCDVNGDALVGGVKYRRVSKPDGDSLSFGDAEYRYFKWEPIRWRILKKDGGKMLLLSDRALSVCQSGEDMSGHLEKFYQDAFGESERSFVAEQSLRYDMEPYFDSDSVKETKEKVFLLCVEDVVNAEYGFCEDPDTYSASRRIGYTDYLGAILWSKYDDGEHSDWSLRSKAYAMGNAFVDYTGWVDKMYGGSSGPCAPAICLDTSPDSGSGENAGGGSGEDTGGGSGENTGGGSGEDTGGGSGEKPAARIPASESWVTLSKTAVTYNGKPQTPSVTVRDGSGRVIGAANYAVTYSGNKNVGEASVTVTFRGNYEGSVTKKFSISPKGTSIKKIKAGRKSFSVKWSRRKVQTAGYEIRYSANKKMKKAVLVNKIKAKKTSRKISGLKAKKTYYVQIRTYQTANGKKYVSKWSAVKKVRTKK